MKLWRRLATFSWMMETIRFCFALLPEPFFFLDNFFCSMARRTSDALSNPGLSVLQPSLSIRNEVSPTSRPTVCSGSINAGTGAMAASSTKTLAKYLPDGERLIVTVFASPTKGLCSFALIPLSFGKLIWPCWKSTVTCCGHWNDCQPEYFDLNRGNFARP